MNRNLKILIGSFFIVSMIWVSGAMAADVAKIGIFDYQRFIENSNAGQNIRKILNSKRVEFEKKLKKKGEEIQKVREQLEREAMVMSPEKQEEKRREYRIKLNDYKEMDNRYTKEIKQTELKETKKLFGELEDIINKIGKDGNFLMIVHQSAVLYSPSQLDITDKVIKIHNKKYGSND